MRRIEVVKVFGFTECYELSTGRLLLWNDRPIFTEHLDKQRPYVHLSQRDNNFCVTVSLLYRFIYPTMYW